MYVLLFLLISGCVGLSAAAEVRQSDVQQLRRTIEEIKALQQVSEERLSHLRTRIAQLLQENDQLTTQLSQRPRAGIISQGAFTASLIDQKELGPRQTVRYDRVAANVGGRYFSGPGMFLCPATGAHFFFWTVHSMGDQRAKLTITQNGQVLTKGPLSVQLVGKSSGTFSMSMILECNMDDAIWVEAEIVDEQETCNLEGEFNTFAGFHLF